VNEGISTTIVAGGTMAGEFTQGLSGGQRKMLLFELIVQRATRSGQQLLIVLDEPFAGVTDDFVPWIVEQLDYLRTQRHNIVLVTNDHVHTLMELADNTITLSAMDRTLVKINQDHTSDRETVLHVLGSVGVDYKFPSATSSDLHFFLQIEVISSKSLVEVAAFTVFFYALFLATYWNSQASSAALILIAGDIVSFFSANPYLLSLVDWRIAVTEEAEALVHSSKAVNRLLKTLLCTLLLLCITSVEYGMINAVVDGMESPQFLVAIFFDLCSTTLPYVVFGLYTNFSDQLVQSLAILPFLFLLLFSTTFSPGETCNSWFGSILF
jgi:energy-coupling factor transporter ATP-binding protein EcfA2